MKQVILSVLVAVSLAQAEVIRIDDKEVVVDTEKGLMWQDNSEAKMLQKNWQGAIGYCQNLNFAGYSDWTLPDIDTLENLHLNKNKLTNMVSDYYWSSSPDVYYDYYAWVVSFGNDIKNSYLKTNGHYIRCVRDYSLTFNSLHSFLEYKESHLVSGDDVVLSVSHSSKSTNFFRVKHDGKIYKGTKDSIFSQLNIKQNKPVYSKSPFVSTQQLTKTKLNSYLTLPLIPKPILHPAINLTKDEFESKVEFADRVQKESAKREAAIANLQEDYRKKVEDRNAELEKRKVNIIGMKKVFLFGSFQEVMGEPRLSIPTYDAETGSMYVTVSMSNANWSKKVAIPMGDKLAAKSFKENFQKATPSVTFGYENDSFILKSIDVGFEDKKYIATLTDKDYQPEKVAVTLESKKVEFSALQNPNLADRYQVQALGYSESAGAKGQKYNDDITPLVNKLQSIKQDSKKWLFAVAIENYDDADKVLFSKQSATDFVKVAQKKFGISERNTYAFIDEKATATVFTDKLEQFLSNMKEGDTIYFYYSGHGIPSPENGEAYFLPKDKVVDFVVREKELMASRVYEKLSKSKASSVIAFVDACFSGKTDNVSNFKGIAAGVLKSKLPEFDKNKMVVMTAGTQNQFSNSYDAKGHRLFSYYLMKNLLESDNIDLDLLYKKTATQVKEVSWKKGDTYKQEPQMIGNGKLKL